MTFTADLADMRTCQSAHMWDACQIGTLSTSQNAIGEYEKTYTYGAEQVCGLETLVHGQARSEFRTPDGTVVYADARLRLTHGTTVAVTSVVRITKRHGTAITAVVYEVLGEPAVGATGIVCYLRKVST